MPHCLLIPKHEQNTIVSGVELSLCIFDTFAMKNLPLQACEIFLREKNGEEEKL
jgi:hypothetical protein